MKRKTAMLIACCAMLVSVVAYEQNGFAASVETVGELNATGGVRFPDGNLQTSACSGCAGGVLTIELGGTGAATASGARENLGVPSLFSRLTSSPPARQSRGT
ncbi:MAG: hypothetical protein HXX11_09750 [Desulfuromonadales bacterium]|nr:hypothetical protein [Desulfuromonadales bacterium]